MLWLKYKVLENYFVLKVNFELHKLLLFGNLLLKNEMNRSLPSVQFNLFPSQSPSLHLRSTVSWVALHLSNNLSFALSASTPVVFGQSGQPLTKI